MCIERKHRNSIEIGISSPRVGGDIALGNISMGMIMVSHHHILSRRFRQSNTYFPILNFSC